MAKRSEIEQLDEALEAQMANPDAPATRINPRLAALLRVAADLQNLPSADFRARLKRELLFTAQDAKPVGGKVLRSHDDIMNRLKEIAEQPQLEPYDLRAAAEGMPDELSMKFIARLSNYTLGIGAGSTMSQWERHPGGDELLLVLDGAMDVVTLTDDGPVRSTVRAGSLLVCPQGLWHRQIPRPHVTQLFVTPTEGTVGSDKEPRVARRRSKTTVSKASKMRLSARSIANALKKVPELIITDETTGADADAAVAPLGSFGEWQLGAMRYTGQTPWERHPDADELLYAIDGEVDVTVMTHDGPVERTLQKGSIFVCPQGLWHRQNARKATMLYGTVIKTSEISFAEDPRVGPSEPHP
jgi:quercetin dioxygenase-like cupin family protein